MQLVINSFGAYLKKKGGCFQVKLQEERVEIPASKVDSILITTSAMISTNAIHYAMENNIDIVLLDQNGTPYARVWNARFGSTTLIRRRQLEASENEIGTKMVLEWSRRKIENQISFLNRLKRTRPEKASFFDFIIKEIEEAKTELDKESRNIGSARMKIMGIEGNASKLYWEGVSNALPEDWRFEGRSRHPSKDPFNAALNYAYGFLYSLVEKACIIAGLDPFIGILHTDDYNKKSFVFDVIEPFRVFVDETIVHLFTRRKMNRDYFEVFPDKVHLSKDGRALLITALNARFDEEELYHNRKMKLRNIIQAEMHSIANSLLKGG
ncbi:CRISPR-associated endonuclease Cas1 [Candidatus Bathyarchaeota archaeon]|nr:CRISPR-associated endonuclease Cas1 [Candidatus Bathyarchaeota archaeon]